MLDTMLFIALPYVALVACIAGSIYRTRTAPMTYSSLSSQFLETKGLMWGSLPWHLGIILILLAHVVAFLVPGLWQNILSNKIALYTIESVGLGLGILSVAGLVVLAVRRLTSAKLQIVTSTMDLVVLVLLLVQISLGVGIAVFYRWGSLWSAGTTTPYIWSILTLRPDVSYISELPLVVKAHILGAWLFILVIPFSRLIHMFAVPFEYLVRPPQNVIWTNSSRAESSGGEIFVQEEARRHFMRAGFGMFIGLLFLSVGAFDKVFRFFFGPRLSKHEETEILEDRLTKLQATVDQRKLELERQASNYILVGSLADFNATKGKYFIDYLMQPAIAFRGQDGLPLLISAKCTHLGCTVGNDVDSKGKILCPCHVSYFDVQTGQPNPDAPAKAPLPHLGWVLMDEHGKLLMSRSPDGHTTGALAAGAETSARVYIAKSDAETA